MTKEERDNAINFLKSYLDEEVYTEKCRNAHEMAIKSLEKEPCEDAISRQTVLDMMQMKMGDKELYMAVYDLPPVTPKPKMGHWIVHRGYNADGFGIEYSCSKCNDWNDEKSKYCPNCGAKMQEVEE